MILFRIKIGYLAIFLWGGAVLQNWIIDGYDACGKVKNKLSEMKRYGNYFTVGFRYFLKRRNVNTILSYQQFYGIIFAWFCKTFHVKKTAKVIVMTFIYNPKSGKVGRLYDKFVRSAVESVYIDKIICFSKQECKEYQNYFKTNADKFTFTLLGKQGHHLSAVEVDSPYILSAGRSNRDYAFLIEAMKDSDYQLKIVTDTLNDKLKSRITDNIQVYDNAFGMDYLNLLVRAKVVVLPLGNPDISSGQLVLIQAMEAGIPVVIMGSNTVEEYITHGENGFVIEKDKKQLEILLDKLFTDKDYYEKVSLHAKKTYQEKGTVEAMAINIAEIANQVS